MRQRDLRSKIWGTLPLVGVLAIALATRVFRLTWPQIWGDEGFSIFLAQSSLDDLFIGTANDLHPPFFYLLLKVWLLPGFDPVYARLFPVFWGVLTVALLYYIGRRLFGPVVGTWAALYLALSPMHIAYSREVRMYVVLAFLSALSVYLIWRWIEDPFPGAWAAYIIVTLMAIYTQNLALFLLPLENVLVIGILVYRKRWRAMGHWLAGQACLLIGYLPWLLVAVYQMFSFYPPWLQSGTLTMLRDTFPHLVFGEPGWTQERTWSIVAYLWLLIVPLAIGVAHLSKRRRWRWPGLFSWLWFLLLAGTLFGLALQFPLYQHKQFLVLTVPLALLVGVGTAGLPKGWRVVLLLSFLALTLPALHNVYFRYRLAEHGPEDEWQEVAAYIDSHAKAGDALFANPGAGLLTLDLYLETSLPREAYPQLYDPQVGGLAGEVATPKRVEAHLGPFARRYERIWLVECCMPTFWDPHRHIRAWLEDWGRPVEIPDFSGLEVQLYEARQPPDP